MTRAVGNLPRFGSVTQSSNAGVVAGITGDAASASFDGRNARLTIQRTDGSRLSPFNGATDRFDSVSYTPIVPGYSFRGDGMLKQTAASVSIAAVYINWNNSDPNDYLAGGYWMHVEGRVFPPQLQAPRSAPSWIARNCAARQRCPSPERRPMPVRQAVSTPTDRVGAPKSGNLNGLASLTADFSTNTISGCIGCNGGVNVSGVAADTSGQTSTFEDVAVPVRLRMSAASILGDGTFRNQSVSLERDDATVTSTSGSWGGRFSTIQDSAGDPRLVAGTAGAEWPNRPAHKACLPARGMP